MNTLHLLNLILWFLFVIKSSRDLLNFLWLFQIKEYRLDRIRAHIQDNFRQQPQPPKIVYGIMIVSFLVLVTNLWLTPFIYFGITFLQTLTEIQHKKLKKPTPTLKVILIACSVIIFKIGIIWIWHTTEQFLPLHLIILNLLIPILILLFTQIINPITNLTKQKIITKARQKMTTMPSTKVIGITGSYGKTSTKEFLYQILATKYKVAKTTDNNNTAIGVAQTVLKLSDQYDFFICEMGAYKQGEITEICEIVKPTIGIITGINNQHLSLFGSQANIKKTKFELIQYLPTDGIAVINQTALESTPHISIKVKNTLPFSSKLLNNIQTFPDHITFDYKNLQYSAKVLGTHYAENLLAAILVAEQLGMKSNEIQAAISNIIPPNKHFIKKITGPNNSILIDDTYSSNTSGVMAAFQYIQNTYPNHKKIFVFPGIIELGEDSQRAHQQIWTQAEHIFNNIYLTKSLPATPKTSKFITITDFNHLANTLLKTIDSNTVVLFESRGAGVVLNKILTDTQI